MATEKTLFAMPETAIGKTGWEGGRRGGLRLAHFSQSGSSTPLIMEEQGWVLLALVQPAHVHGQRSRWRSHLETFSVWKFNTH